MLKKINRISLKSEIEEIKNQGKMLPGRLLGMLVLKKEDGEKKFGMIVSKKISKKAVERNRARRQVMEVIRRSLDGIPRGVRGLILAKPGLIGQKERLIEEEIKRMMERM
jgi:ribonuclease P protein component